MSGDPDHSGPLPSRIAVVGTGTMGVGIAIVFALHGVPAVLVDTTAERGEAARLRTSELLAQLEQLGAIEPGAAAAAASCLTSTPSLATGVADADLIVEAVFERPAVKQEAYAAIEAAASSSAIIATNTSSIPIASLAAGLRVPSRFLGVHWFVPPLLVPCVEVIPAPDTDARVVSEVVATLTALGKTAVVVGDGPGFVANRIQFALFREAARIVDEGIATAEQVDAVVSSSFGFRLPFFGPFTIADMAGLDVYADIYATLERGLGPTFAAPAMLTAQVERGDLGVKSGRGFLDISAAEGQALLARRDRAYLELARLRANLDP